MKKLYTFDASRVSRPTARAELNHDIKQKQSNMLLTLFIWKRMMIFLYIYINDVKLTQYSFIILIFAFIYSVFHILHCT